MKKGKINVEIMKNDEEINKGIGNKHTNKGKLGEMKNAKGMED
jgi:hypothetical protein